MNFVLRNYAAAIGLYDGSIFYTGGIDSTYSDVSKSSYIYFPEEDRAVEKAQSIQPRYTHTVCHLGNFIYSLGGRGVDGVITHCEKYSISQNSWESICPLNSGRCTFPAVVVNQELIYVFGGYTGNSRSDSIEVYDPIMNMWTLLSVKLPMPLEAHSGTLINNKEILLMGGHDSNKGTKHAIIFSTHDSEFHKVNDLPVARYLHTAFKYEDGIYVIGGEEDCYFDCFDLQSNSWKLVTNFKEVLFHSLKTFATAIV